MIGLKVYMLITLYIHFLFSSSPTKLPDVIDCEVAVAAFQSQRADLLEAIWACLTILANKLLAKFIINRDVLEKACNDRYESARDRGVYLLDRMQDRITTVPSDFITIVDILKSEPTLTILAGQIVDSYSEYNNFAHSLSDN